MDWMKGMDISMLPELEEMGAVFRDNGIQEDMLVILKRYGVNTIRVRIWNDPYDEEGNSYGGGTNDLKMVEKFARRVKDMGFSFMLDIHYSDFWTDPKKQVKPRAWKDMDFTELKKEVYQYTSEILESLKEKGLLPDIVQVGNEITNGFLWPEGQLPTYQNCKSSQPVRNYGNMFELLKEGIRAVRDSEASIKILLHLDYGGDNGLYREWFDQAQEQGVDYDVIGLSYYPYWHGSLKNLKYNLDDISKRYQKDVVVVETAYGYTLEEQEGCALIFNDELAKTAGYPASPAGQAQFLRDLAECIRGVEDKRGMGFVYWEPGWLPVKGSTWASREGQEYMKDEADCGNSWANQALFDYEGNALLSLKIIPEL